MSEGESDYHADLELIVTNRVTDKEVASSFTTAIRSLRDEVCQYLSDNSIGYKDTNRISQLVDSHVVDKSVRTTFFARHHQLQEAVLDYIISGKPFIADGYVIGRGKALRIKGDEKLLNRLAVSKDTDIYAEALASGESIVVVRD